MINKQARLIKHYKLKDSIKNYNGYKVKSPEETLKNINSAFEKLGLKVKYKEKNDSLHKKFKPFSSGNSILCPVKNEKVILLQSGGKGVSPILSQASATAELIERFTGYGLLGKGLINCYLSTIKRNRLWQNKKDELTESLFPFHSMGTIDIVPNKYKENFDKLKKSVCFCLTDERLYTYPEEFITKIEGSNGLASGNTLEEAALHAIYELIERLGGMYVLDNLPKTKRIKKSSVTHPTLKDLMNAVNSQGINFEMLDFSYVFDIPLIVTIFTHKDWNMPPNPYSKRTTQYPKIIIGVDSDPQDAAMRCFTELIQGIEPIEMSINNDRELIEQFRTSKINLPVNQKKYLRSAAVAFTNGNQPISVNLKKYSKADRKEISINKLPNLYHKNQKIEIKRIVKTLKNHGFEVFIEDLTHPDLNFPVARAILSGGKDYFETIPLIGYAKLVLDARNKKIRYSRLNKFVEIILTQNPLHKILIDREWIFGSNTKKLIDIVVGELCYNGVRSELWGMPINKLYFIGMMYLRKKRYEKAKNCFRAVLNLYENNIPSLLGMAYIYSKKNMNNKYDDVLNKINKINDGSFDVQTELDSFDDLIIDPNPFEPCNCNCNNKINPNLCNNCFFNYVDENDFMVKKLDYI